VSIWQRPNLLVVEEEEAEMTTTATRGPLPVQFPVALCFVSHGLQGLISGRGLV